jgi:putative MATE family efflux protein
MPKVSKKTKKVNVFEVPITKGLLTLAWPIILANLLQTIYNITDAYFLGKLGPKEFSVPTIVFPIVFVFISLAAGFSHAGSSMVAQYTGMGEKRNAEKSAAQTIITVFVISALIMVIGLILSDSLVSIMQVEQDIHELAVFYLRIILLGLPFLFSMELIAGIFRGWGNSVIALKLMFFAVVTNIILDPIFIFVIDWGVVGAAVATIISRGTFAGVFAYILFSGKLGFKVHMKDFKPDFRFIKKVLSIGLPASLGQSVTAFGFTIITSVVSQFGPVVISAYGVGNRINSMVVMFAVGMSLATGAMAAQFIGADHKEKAVETVRKAGVITFITILGISILLFFFGQYITQFFINDPEVIEVGVIFFQLVSFSLPFFALMDIFMGTLRGTGHTIQSTIVDMVRLWGIRVPLILIMSETWGYKGVFYAMIISNVSAMILSFLFIKFGNWKDRIVEDYSETLEEI